MSENQVAELSKFETELQTQNQQAVSERLFNQAWQDSSPSRPAPKLDYPFPMPQPKPKPGPIRPEDLMPPLQILDNGKSLIEFIEELNKQDRSKQEPKKNRIADPTDAVESRGAGRHGENAVYEGPRAEQSDSGLQRTHVRTPVEGAQKAVEVKEKH